jgi:hypothetical protein
MRIGAMKDSKTKAEESTRLMDVGKKEKRKMFFFFLFWGYWSGA